MENIMLPSPDTTRERLLAAGAAIFARRGFAAATVREICQEAGANVASVNYYFTDKMGLYRAVIEEALNANFRNCPPDAGVNPDNSPEENLHGFIRAFFRRLTAGEGPGAIAPKTRLILRELAEPTPALDWIVSQRLAPLRDVLFGIVAGLLGSAASPERIMRCGLSVIGQCAHYALAGPLISRATNVYPVSEEDLDRVAHHIFLFSLGGIERVCREAGNSPGGTSKDSET